MCTKVCTVRNAPGSTTFVPYTQNLNSMKPKLMLQLGVIPRYLTVFCSYVVHSAPY